MVTAPLRRSTELGLQVYLTSNPKEPYLHNKKPVKSAKISPGKVSLMSKITKFAISMLIVALIALAFGTGYQMGGRAQPSHTEESLNIIEEAWNVIFSDYVDKDQLDTKTLRRAAIEGMLESLDDPYTSYLDIQHYQLGVSSLEGEFNGIGAQVGMRDNQITIIAPIAGSPADKAGIRAGDIILEINGNSTEEMSLAKAVLNIRGSQGTPVRLLILHQDETVPEEIEIIRDKVELDSVRSETKGDIFYINITQFSERTDQELTEALQNNLRQEDRGIILDLRSNPGGLLESVVDVASHFLHEGAVVSVVSNQETLGTLNVRSSRVTTDLPMVILTDNFSASGSEVLAGAMQDHGRATIAGHKTFGKGSVNILRRLEDGSGIYITTARWLTPNGRLIEGEGIAPDYELELTDDDAIRWAIGYLTSNK